MADFCKQCSISHFGEDYENFKFPEPPGEGMEYAALCEGCGPTGVDETGKCLYHNHPDEAMRCKPGIPD